MKKLIIFILFAVPQHNSWLQLIYAGQRIEGSWPENVERRRWLKELCSMNIKKRRAGRKKSKIAMNPHHTIQLTNLYRYPITLRALFNEFLLGHRTVFINIIPLHAPRSFIRLQRSGIGRMPNNPGFQRSGIGRIPNNPGTSNQSQNVSYHEIKGVQ